MIKVGIYGATGRMGKEVTEAISHQQDFKLAKLYARQPENDMTNSLQEFFSDLDVVIDFSTPDAVGELINYLKEHENVNPAIISGTTSLSEEMQEELKFLSARMPILHSNNFSFMIASMKKIVKDLAGLFPEADIEIVESHHRGKVDAPSGTAITLAQAALHGREGKGKITSKERFNLRRENNDINISSIRGGNIFGEHIVRFICDNEEIIVSHSSFNRKLFANSVLKLTKIITSKENGWFIIEDFLK